MSLKQVYRGFLRRKERSLEAFVLRKTWLIEWVAILQKSRFYKDVKWTQSQQKEFDDFWVEHYGKKISNRWHRHYQSLNGCFTPSYIPEILYTTKLEPKWNRYLQCKQLEDKSLIELLIAKKCDDKLRVPETYLVVSHGVLYDKDRNCISRQQARQILSGVDAAVVKPSMGASGGSGVQVMTGLSRNQDPLELLLSQFGEDFIVQEKLSQCETLNKLYPKSINTVRITTYLWNEQVYHWPIYLRLGIGGNEVDNIHKGGIGIYVDDAGFLAPVGYSMGSGWVFQKWEKHPDTQVVFDRYHLPFMPAVIEAAHTLHGCFPGIGVISWDVAVEPSGALAFIEANLFGQGIWYPQITSGQSAFQENTTEILRAMKRNG